MKALPQEPLLLRAPGKWRPLVWYPPDGQGDLRVPSPEERMPVPFLSLYHPIPTQVSGSTYAIRPHTRDPNTSVIICNISARSLFPPNVHSEEEKTIILKVGRRGRGQIV